MSNNTYYNIYLNNNIALAKSIIIKLNLVANAMNLELQEFGVEVSEDLYQWRYYKHLAGEYHSFDTAMTITSLDTGNEILFNKENLSHHKKTRALYITEGNYLIDLYRRYPSQSNLIKGILFPIDISVAVNSKDGAILYYNPNFVETQEYNLIPDLEQWVSSYLYRVAMQSYTESDDLFAASVCGLLYVNLPTTIINIRSNYTKTAQVHSFHISSYLASYNRLDEFIPYLTFEQQLFLYLNIDYIVRHTGMAETFNLLLKKLLTDRNLPVFDYTLQQSNILLENGQLQPTPVFIKNKLNLDSGLTSRSLDIVDVKSVVTKEAYHAINNALHVDRYVAEAECLASQSSISKLPSKILEVSAIDPEDIAPSKLTDVIINEWAFHAANKTYLNTIEIINPLNGDPFKIDVLDAFNLYFYSYASGFLDMTMEHIPPFLAYDVAQYEWVKESEYLALAEHSDFGAWDRDIDFFMHSNLELPAPLLLASDFLDRCRELNSRRNTRYQWVENKLRYEEKATVKCFYNYSYKDVWCNLNPKKHKDYASFFKSISMNDALIDREMWKDIALDCLNKATNFTNNNTASLREIQSSMVKLFKRLSSYTIQFLEEIASNDSVIADTIIVIPGDTASSVSSEAYIENIKVEALGTGTSESFVINGISQPVQALYVEYDNDINVEAEIGVGASCKFEIISSANIVLGQSRVIEIIKKE